MAQDAGREIGALCSQILQGSSDLKDMNAAQRLVRAAADPLILLARHTASLLVSSTYSSTALALNGGLGAVRVFLGASLSVPDSLDLQNSASTENPYILLHLHGKP